MWSHRCVWGGGVRGVRAGWQPDINLVYDRVALRYMHNMPCGLACMCVRVWCEEGGGAGILCPRCFAPAAVPLLLCPRCCSRFEAVCAAGTHTRTDCAGAPEPRPPQQQHHLASPCECVCVHVDMCVCTPVGSHGGHCALLLHRPHCMCLVAATGEGRGRRVVWGARRVKKSSAKQPDITDEAKCSTSHTHTGAAVRTLPVLAHSCTHNVHTPPPH